MGPAFCLWDQLSLDGFLYDEANCAASPSFRRIAANHGDDTLLLRVAQQRLGARTRFVVKRAIQTLPLVSVSDASDGLRRHLLQGSRHLRSCRTLGQMEQRQRAKDDSYRLHSAAQEFIEQVAIFTRNEYTDEAAGHTLRISRNILDHKWFIIEPFHAV